MIAFPSEMASVPQGDDRDNLGIKSGSSHDKQRRVDRGRAWWKWLALALLLALTLGWKIAVRSGGSGATTDEPNVADFLARHGLIVLASQPLTEGHPTIHAIAGTCRVLVAKSPPLGSHRDVIARYATPADRVFVVFGGTVYAEQPTWLTVSDYLWARLRRELGMNARAKAVLTIIATRSCDAERLPWDELR